MPNQKKTIYKLHILENLILSYLSFIQVLNSSSHLSLGTLLVKSHQRKIDRGTDKESGAPDVLFLTEIFW